MVEKLIFPATTFLSTRIREYLSYTEQMYNIRNFEILTFMSGGGANPLLFC